ncbi:MAG: metallophosphoesterase, partial [Candidatus Vogelbacteria bacterium]|nr:metallophosphoesterase [Candidatus Vogelbacteria bacterium]
FNCESTIIRLCSNSNDFKSKPRFASKSYEVLELGGRNKHMRLDHKNIKLLSLLLVAILLLSGLIAYKIFYPSNKMVNPFDNGGNKRNMIVVLSDVHLGADLNYAECKNNLGALEKLLKQIKEAKNIKELVIAGDLVDEWFVPATVDTYQGKNQTDFVQRIAQANKGVFDVINNIIQEGNILVTYVPGNHDLTITATNIENVFPGINQARDKTLGLGTYSPVDYPKIAVEHGHRYNFFCAPDPISNQKIAPGTILPPGYFFTRIAALHVIQGRPLPGDTTPVISPNASGGESQDLLYKYWKLWDMTVKLFPITNKFNEDIIVTNVNGFSGSNSVNDLIPYQSTPGGTVDVNLFKGIQDNWEARQTLNNVSVHTMASRAIDLANSATETDYQAILQYFMIPDSNKRIVVFGHTHEPKIVASKNYNNKKSLYANSGTWIDHNQNKTTMNFVVITPQSNNIFSKTFVKLYNFQNEVVTKMAEDSLRY